MSERNETMPDGRGHTEGPEPSRASLPAVLWRRRWIVAGAMLAALVTGGIYLMRAPSMYVSTSRLYVEQAGPKIISEVQGVMTQSKNYLYTQCELLTSSPILSAALEQAEVRESRTLAEASNALTQLKKSLHAEVGKRDDIISLSLESAYPQEAAGVVNAVVNAYIDYHARQKRSTAAEVLRILQKEKVKRDAELDQKLAAMLAFKRDNGAISFENDKGNILLQQISRMSDAVTSAQLEAIEAAANAEAAEAMLHDPQTVRELAALQVSSGLTWSGSDYNQLRQSLQQERVRLMELQRQFTAETPTVQAAQARVQQLESEVTLQEQELAQTYVAGLNQQLRACQEKSRQLQSSFEEQQRRAQELNVKAAEYAVLESDLKRLENLCDILEGRIREINVTEDTGALNISVLEVAKAPDEPVSPSRPRVLAVAMTLGLVAGALAALLLEWLDQTLRSADEITRLLKLPVLGVVPHGTRRQTPVQLARQVNLHPHSHSAEAYRTVRTAIYFGVPKGKARSVLITSAAPGDGKSTLASNLAIAMAQAGQRTLLLDADFRRPVQQKIFAVSDSGGVSSVLAGRAALEEAVCGADVPLLDVLPCGPIPPNPSELLNSDAFAELLARLTERYDHVVVDSPPALLVADAQILSALCDVTLLAVRSNKSTRKPVEEACRRLHGVGAHILGVVVTDLSPAHDQEYGAYRYYGAEKAGAGRHVEDPAVAG